jgi:hypothetical protein
MIGNEDSSLDPVGSESDEEKVNNSPDAVVDLRGVIPQTSAAPQLYDYRLEYYLRTAYLGSHIVAGHPNNVAAAAHAMVGKYDELRIIFLDADAPSRVDSGDLRSLDVKSLNPDDKVQTFRYMGDFYMGDSSRRSPEDRW